MKADETRVVETASVPLLERRKKLEELMGICVEDRRVGFVSRVQASGRFF